jgi:ankyrin repeat protein
MGGRYYYKDDWETPDTQMVNMEFGKDVSLIWEGYWDINTQGNDGMLPLDVAILKGNMEITRILLERNATSGKSSTHIVSAARFGFVDLLQLFVDMKHDINVKDENGESPLHAACKSGQVDTVQYLCEHGALLYLRDSNGNTALHVAVSNGHLDATRVLVKKGANLRAADV